MVEYLSTRGGDERLTFEEVRLAGFNPLSSPARAPPFDLTHAFRPSPPRRPS
jgi:hypothetical protein